MKSPQGSNGEEPVLPLSRRSSLPPRLLGEIHSDSVRGDIHNQSRRGVTRRLRSLWGTSSPTDHVAVVRSPFGVKLAKRAIGAQNGNRIGMQRAMLANARTPVTGPPSRRITTTE